MKTPSLNLSANGITLKTALCAQRQLEASKQPSSISTNSHLSPTEHSIHRKVLQCFKLNSDSESQIRFSEHQKCLWKHGINQCSIPMRPRCCMIMNDSSLMLIHYFYIYKRENSRQYSVAASLQVSVYHCIQPLISPVINLIQLCNACIKHYGLTAILTRCVLLYFCFRYKHTDCMFI